MVRRRMANGESALPDAVDESVRRNDAMMTDEICREDDEKVYGGQS